MSNETQWLAVAWISNDSKAPGTMIREVKVVAIGGTEFIEFDDGQRWLHWSGNRLFPSQAAAELHCADTLEKLATPIAAEAARLRDQAAARVAAESVVTI